MNQKQEKVVDENKEISLDTRIQDLALPVRTKRRLCWHGINTLQDLLNIDYQEIKHIKSIGEKHLIELRNYINSLGYQLLNEKLTTSEKREKLKNEGCVLLEDYNLSSQVYLTLYRNDIYTLDDLVEYGIKVYDLKGFGPNRQQELREKLQELNIQLENKEKQKVKSLLEHVKSNPNLTRENLPDEIASIKIQDLDLSNRIKTYFKYNKITTLGQLLNTDYETIKGINKLGEVSLNELKNYIHRIGFTLLNEEEDISGVIQDFGVIQELREKGADLLENYGLSSKVCDPLYQHGIYTLEDVLASEEVFYVKGLTQTGRKELLAKVLTLVSKKTPGKEQAHPTDIASTKKNPNFWIRTGLEYTANVEIAELGLTVKIYNILIRNNIQTLEDLVNYGPSVFQLDGLTFEDKEKIKKILAEYDIEFLTDDNDVMSSSYEETLQDIKKENEMIQIRYQRKKQLLKEYNDLMQERSSLLEKEAELDRKLEENLLKMQEEVKGKSYVRSK